MKKYSLKQLTEVVYEVMKMKERTVLHKNKVNEGDIVEGIFALAVGLYLAEGKIDIDKLVDLRKSVLPDTHASAKQEILILRDPKLGPDPDRMKVVVELRFKSPKSVGVAFGPELQNPGRIEKKVATLAAKIIDTHAFDKISKFKRFIVGNQKNETIQFKVVADGLEGETTHGTVKGDVMFHIQVSSNVDPNAKELISDLDNKRITFSLKSGSITLSNLSPYNGMKQIAEWFGIPNFPPKEFEVLAQRAITPEIKKAKYDAAGRIMIAFSKELEKRDMGGSPDFTKKAFEFLEKSAFGEDKADIIDMRPGNIREITQAHINALKESGMIIDTQTKVTRGGTVYVNFVSVPRTEEEKPRKLFHLRIKRRKSGEIKAYVEVGELAYAPKK